MELTLYYSHRYHPHWGWDDYPTRQWDIAGWNLERGILLEFCPLQFNMTCACFSPFLPLGAVPAETRIISHSHYRRKCFLTGVPRHFFTVSIVCLLTTLYLLNISSDCALNSRCSWCPRERVCRNQFKQYLSHSQVTCLRELSNTLDAANNPTTESHFKW